MATSIAALAERDQENRDKAAAAYDELLDALEADNDVDERKALKTVADAGKSLGDVTAELKRRQRLAELREVIAGEAALRDEDRNITSQLQEKRVELREAPARINREIEQLDRRSAALAPRLVAIDQARRELRKLVPVSQETQELKRELRLVTAKAAALEARMGRREDPARLAAEIARLRGQIEELHAAFNARRDAGTAAAVFPRARLAVLERELGELERHKSRAALAEQLDQLRDRQRQIHQQLAALDAAHASRS